MGEDKSTKSGSMSLSGATESSSADLPPRDTRRWVASRKAEVIKLVEEGQLSKETVLEHFEISDEEFRLWQLAVHCHGIDALKVTLLQKFRKM